MKVRFTNFPREFKELKVDMNYKTGRRGENNCRIVSAGSELDILYQKD